MSSCIFFCQRPYTELSCALCSICSCLNQRECCTSPQSFCMPIYRIQSDLVNPPPLVPGLFLGGLEIAGLAIDPCIRVCFLWREICSKPFSGGLAFRRINQRRIRQVWLYMSCVQIRGWVLCQVSFLWQGVTSGTINDKQVPDDTTTTSISGLFPGERYEINIQTISDTRSSEPQGTNAVTRE